VFDATIDEEQTDFDVCQLIVASHAGQLACCVALTYRHKIHVRSRSLPLARGCSLGASTDAYK
jgi:hypothetical protein